jgi:hypothetical protein
MPGQGHAEYLALSAPTLPAGIGQSLGFAVTGWESGLQTRMKSTPWAVTARQNGSWQ